MIDLTQYLSSITLKTAEKRLFWAFLKPIWVLKGIKIIFFTIISLYNDFWGQTKPLTTPNRDRLDTPHIIPYVHCTHSQNFVDTLKLLRSKFYMILQNFSKVWVFDNRTAHRIHTHKCKKSLLNLLNQ